MRRPDAAGLLLAPALILLLASAAAAVPARAQEDAARPAHPPPAPEGAGDEALEEVTRKVLCACGGCVNQTLYECTCGTAASERKKIAGLLAAGTPSDRIIQGYVEQYGLQILITPEKSGFNLFGWLVPFIATAAGLLALVLVLRGWMRPPAVVPPAAPSPEPRPADAEERRYREEVEKDLKELQI